MTDLASGVRFSAGDSVIRAALAGLAARQRTIANNVANVDTPNFRAGEVRFEDGLRAAVNRRAHLTTGQAALNAAAARVTPIQDTVVRADGNNVDVDREMEQLSETTLTFGALSQAMSTRLGILRSVINGR